MRLMHLTALLGILALGGCGMPAAEPALPSISAAATATASAAPAVRATAAPRRTAAPTPTPAPLCPAVDETTFDATQIVLATANVFGAGHDVGPAPGGGGRGTLPTLWPIAPGAASVEVTCAMGLVIPIRGVTGANDAEGDLVGGTNIESFEGISGIINTANGMFLTGVFLTDAEPADPAPERLDFSGGADFESLSPLLAQTFFVGDGEGRRFVVPAGATRLFLGFADAAGYLGLPGWYGNNAGYLDVTVAVSG